MNWMCDLYCYYSDHGLVTHVASNRYTEEPPSLPSLDHSGFLEAHEKQMAWLEKAEKNPIELPYAGETFCDTDTETFRARLIEMRALGYRFPDYLLEVEVED